MLSHSTSGCTSKIHVHKVASVSVSLPQLVSSSGCKTECMRKIK